MRRYSSIFYGWWIVAAGVGVTMLSDIFLWYGFGAFFIAWRDAFGWSRALLGGVQGMSRLVGGLMAPLTGWLIDRYGPRPMMFLGLGILGLGFIALSRISSVIMLYVVFVGLISVGNNLGTFRTVMVSVANWFIRRRGRAMGIVMLGPGLGGSLVFLFALVIDAYGWRWAAVIAGISIWVLGFPLATVFRHRPEQMGLLPDGISVSEDKRGIGSSSPRPRVHLGADLPEFSAEPQIFEARRFWMRDPRPEIDLTVWQALRDQAFWVMALTNSLWVGLLGIVSVHLAPFVSESLKVGSVNAVSALSLFAFASLFGRIAFGFLADYVDIRLLVATLLCLAALGILLISTSETYGEALIYIVFLALPYGGLMAINGVLLGYFFGRKAFGTIGGTMQLVNLPASMSAPIWLGWLADALPDGYRLGFRIVATSLVVAASLILLARRPRHPLPADRPPAVLQALRRG